MITCSRKAHALVAWHHSRSEPSYQNSRNQVQRTLVGMTPWQCFSQGACKYTRDCLAPVVKQPSDNLILIKKVYLGANRLGESRWQRHLGTKTGANTAWRRWLTDGFWMRLFEYTNKIVLQHSADTSEPSCGIAPTTRDMTSLSTTLSVIWRNMCKQSMRAFTYCTCKSVFFPLCPRIVSHYLLHQFWLLVIKVRDTYHT